MLFAFAALMPQLPTWALWLAIALCAAWMTALGNGALRFYAGGLWRLRWLFFAIIVLHLWRGSGPPLWDVLPGLTGQGAAEASRRSAILAALLAAVVLLVRSTPPQWLAAGLIWCLHPLRAVRFPVDRLGMRIALVFGAVDGAREAAGERRAGTSLEDAAARLVLRAEAGDFHRGAVEPVPAAGWPSLASFLLMLLAVAVPLLAWLYR